MFAVFAVVAAATAVGAVALRSADERIAVVAAALLAGANTLVAHLLSTWGARRSNRAFFTAVLVGTFVRMALVLGVVYLALAVWAVPRVPFVATLLTLFAVFLALELRTQARAMRRATA